MCCRFEIEDVEEPHLTHTSIQGDPNMTVSSLGYNTAEAVPMTVYYRKTGEGSSRPTLEDLRHGRVDKPARTDTAENQVRERERERERERNFSFSFLLGGWRRRGSPSLSPSQEVAVLEEKQRQEGRTCQVWLDHGSTGTFELPSVYHSHITHT